MGYKKEMSVQKKRRVIYCFVQLIWILPVAVSIARVTHSFNVLKLVSCLVDLNKRKNEECTTKYETKCRSYGHKQLFKITVLICLTLTLHFDERMNAANFPFVE